MTVLTISPISSLPAGPAVLASRRAVTRVMRRRRLVALLLLVVTVAALAALVAPRLATASAGSGPAASRGDGAAVQVAPALREHRIMPGDTLWNLAAEVDPAADPREVVDRIIALNGMASTALQPGETVLLPVVG